MKAGLRKLRRAFTLVEMTIVLMMAMMIGAIVLSLFSQQMAFLRIFQAQNFITEEAPMISVYLNRLVGKADRYRLHTSLDEALTGVNPQTTSSPVCVLNFRMPNGTMRAAILSFADLGDGPALYYYIVPEAGVLTGPQFAITSKADNVEFFMEQGILRTRLTGPQGEQLTYSGATQ